MLLLSLSLQLLDSPLGDGRTSELTAHCTSLAISWLYFCQSIKQFQLVVTMKSQGFAGPATLMRSLGTLKKNSPKYVPGFWEFFREKNNVVPKLIPNSNLRWAFQHFKHYRRRRSTVIPLQWVQSKISGRAKSRPQIKLTKYWTRDLMIPNRLELHQTINETLTTYRNRKIQERSIALHNHAESRW